MANHSNDRARMRNDLRELARLAKAEGEPSTPSHRFETADSSGYVDLSAYSATDSGWVDRELARAKGGGGRSLPPPVPQAGRSSGRAIDALSPESMAPVALDAFLVADGTAKTRVPRGRRVLYGVLGLASVAGVAALAFVVARHAPPPTTKAEVAAAVAAPPPAPATTEQAPPAQTAAGTAPSSAAPPAAASPTETAPAASTATAKAAAGPKKKAPPAARAHGAPPAAAARATAAAAAAPAMKPAVIPPSHGKPSGDSLMDAIRSSVASGK